MSAEPTAELAVPEQLVSPESEKLLKVMSDAYARGDGYALDFVVEPGASTFATSCTVDDEGRIKVHLSPELLKRAEAEDRLDFLGFATLHELGHVKRYQAQPPKGISAPKDNYFSNIVDDIAINYGNARRTRFFYDMTKRVYDDYLFPKDARAGLADDPRHKQFMETLLVLSMTTNAHAKSDLPKLLKDADLPDLDEDVMAAVSDILTHEQGDKTYNLLGQLRAYGSDLRYTSQVASVIREHYDALYEADMTDKSDQSGQPSDGQGSGHPSDSKSGEEPSDGDNQSFDYSDSASCGHGKPQVEPPKPGEKSIESKRGDKNDEKADAKYPAKGDDSKEGDQGDPLDIASIAEEIAKDIKEALPDAQANNTRDQARDYTPEQLAQLRAELGLDESDFASYMASRAKFANEILALQDLLLQLRHDRQNEFLAPGREVAARGHRIKVEKLVRAIASQALGDQPDIWKTPILAENIEHEFDGLDLYLLCDVSGSMAGEKAEGAAGASVVLEEGLLGSSSQMAGEHTPLVRLQIGAFGSGHGMLCKLTDEPSMKDLGRTYASLKNPTSSNTQVSGALSVIKPEAGRLSVVVIVSDGGFHDESLAKQEGQKLADKNAAIIQLVFGGAQVAKLADNAHRVNLNTARELPEQLLNILPELIETLRRSTDA